MAVLAFPSRRYSTFTSVPGAVPDDAAVVFVAGPKKAFFPEEVAALKAFRDQGGALFLMLEPTDTPDAALAEIRKASCGPVAANAAAREERLATNFKQMIASGVRLVLSTDAGIASRHSFGWADHHEIAHWVDLGLSPSHAIVAATSRPVREA